jgi:uncharacterized protein (DUF433 family)
MDWHDRITIDPNVLVGKPVVKGTRLSVEFIIGLLSQGWSEAEVLRNYPVSPQRMFTPVWPMPKTFSKASGSFRLRAN